MLFDFFFFFFLLLFLFCNAHKNVMIFGLCYVISKYHNIFVSTTKQIKKKRKLMKFGELWLHLGTILLSFQFLRLQSRISFLKIKNDFFLKKKKKERDKEKKKRGKKTCEAWRFCSTSPKH